MHVQPSPVAGSTPMKEEASQKILRFDLSRNMTRSRSPSLADSVSPPSLTDQRCNHRLPDHHQTLPNNSPHDHRLRFNTSAPNHYPHVISPIPPGYYQGFANCDSPCSHYSNQNMYGPPSDYLPHYCPVHAYHPALHPPPPQYDCSGRDVSTEQPLLSVYRLVHLSSTV